MQTLVEKSGDGGDGDDDNTSSVEDDNFLRWVKYSASPDDALTRIHLLLVTLLPASLLPHLPRFARSSRVLECPLIQSIALSRVQRRGLTVQKALGIHQHGLDPRYHLSRSRCHEISEVDGSKEEKWRKG